MMIIRYEETRDGEDTICDMDEYRKWHLVTGNPYVAELLNIASNIWMWNGYLPVMADAGMMVKS